MPEPNPRRNATLVASNEADAPEGDERKLSDPLAEIVAGCQRGDRQAERQLYERCQGRLFRLLVNIGTRRIMEDFAGYAGCR